MSLPQAKQIRGYLKRAVALNYLGRLVSVILLLAIVLAAGVYVGGMWAMQKAPYGHPITAFHVGQALVLLFILAGFGWPKLRRCLSLEEMAIRLERKDPALNEALSSALEFSAPDPVMEQALQSSLGILPGFYQDTLERIGSRRRFRRIVPWYFWPVAVLAVTALLFWLNVARFTPFTGQDIWVAYREFFLANPYRPLHTLKVEPGFSTLLKGESLPITATLEGPGTHTGTIRYSMAGFPQETAEMKPRGYSANTFEFNFENLQSDLTYQIEAGPLKTLEYTVTVKDPPELTYVQLTYFFPDFMKRNVEVIPPGQGAAAAPVGTTVEVSTRWNQSMEKIFLTVNDGEPAALEKRGSFWKQSFSLQTAGRYVLSGTSETGVRIRDGLEFPIQAVEDLPPEIEWVWPLEDLDLSKVGARRKIPLKYKVRDDNGIETVQIYAGAPGRATRSYEIANLEGQEVEYAQTYNISLKPFEDDPVVRIYFVASDNHPGHSNQTPTQIRRLFLKPPGTFSEAEDATDELQGKTDPFELSALELFHLIKVQREQNSTVNETVEVTEELKTQWTEKETKLAQITSQTALRVYNRAGQSRVGSGQGTQGPMPGPGRGSTSAPQEAASPPEQAGEEEALADLANRLDRVVARLIGDIRRLEELVPGAVPGGSSALDYQLRQLDAGVNARYRRSREEGERSLRELEAAFKELTGKNPPRDYADAEKEREKEEGEKDDRKEVEDPGEGDDKGKEQEGEEEGEEGKEKEGDEGEGKEGEEFTFGPGDEEIVRTLQGTEGGAGIQENAEGEGGAALPTNVYAPSAYTLDPDSVHLDSASSRLLQRTLADNLSGMDLSEYQKEPIPAEYEEIVTEYNRALLGE